MFFCFFIHAGAGIRNPDSDIISRVQFKFRGIAFFFRKLHIGNQYLFEFLVSFLGKRNGDKKLPVLIYPCVSVSDVFIDYLHDDGIVFGDGKAINLFIYFI